MLESLRKSQSGCHALARGNSRCHAVPRSAGVGMSCTAKRKQTSRICQMASRYKVMLRFAPQKLVLLAIAIALAGCDDSSNSGGPPPPGAKPGHLTGKLSD